MDARRFRALGNKALVVQQLVEQAAASIAQRTAAALKAARTFALREIESQTEVDAGGFFIRTSTKNVNTRIRIEAHAAQVINASLPGILQDMVAQFNRAERLARAHTQQTLKHFGASLPADTTDCLRHVEQAKAEARKAIADFVAHVVESYHGLMFSRMTLGQSRNELMDRIEGIRGDRQAARKIAQELTQLFAACISSLAEHSDLGHPDVGEPGGVLPVLYWHFGPKDERNVTDIVSANPPGLIDPDWRGYGSRDFIGRVFAGWEWELVSPNWQEGWLHFNERGVFQPADPRDPEIEAKHQADRRWMESVLGFKLRETPPI